MPNVEAVMEYYSKLKGTKDLKTDACCTLPAPHIATALKRVPFEISEKFYGCGNPIPNGIEGLTVLDLGCGTGRDCYVASQLVGSSGTVIGIDMTDPQLEVANKYVDSFTKDMGYKRKNMKFVKGYIENIKSVISPESVDLIISNCVINLSPDKTAVLKQCYDSLKLGGEMHFSDVYSDRRLPESVRRDDVLVGECLGGAMYRNDFVQLCHEIGFTCPRILVSKPIEINNEELQEKVGNIKFYSITFRLFKLKSLDPNEEDYGQIAIYKGTIPRCAHGFTLDEWHVFETNRAIPVSGNTADIVSNSWLSKHFKVIGDRSTHFGEFGLAVTVIPPRKGEDVDREDVVANESKKEESCKPKKKGG